MQITIEIPDDLSPNIIQYYVTALQRHFKQIANEREFNIDKQACLDAWEKIKNGDKTDCIEIDDIDKYIENLTNALE